MRVSQQLSYTIIADYPTMVARTVEISHDRNRTKRVFGERLGQQGNLRRVQRVEQIVCGISRARRGRGMTETV